MKFERRFTTADRPVADQVEWKTVPALIDRKSAELVDVEVPAHWSQNAANIFADMYLRKAGVPSPADLVENVVDRVNMPAWLRPSIVIANCTPKLDAETSARQVFHRLAGAWTYHGWVEGYFKAPSSKKWQDVVPLANNQEAEENARAFYDEIYWCLAAQLAAPNSPQWFNTGLWWVYGIEGPDTGMWRVDLEYRDGGSFPEPVMKAHRIYNSYQYPQPHACFLTSTADELVGPGGIMDTWVREARIFKHGSGSGINPSVWRATNEPLSGGGRASGMMSWLSIGDRGAGATKSGGTNRRAAKMVCVDDDHPELLDFIRLKTREEGKAEAMDVGSQVLRLLYEGRISDDLLTSLGIEVAQPMRDRLANGFEPELLPAEWESEAMRSVDGQNANTSMRPTDYFMRAVEEDESWSLTARTTGNVLKTVPARAVWDEVCRAAWASGDPGIIFHDTVNAWHTTPADGPITTTNPCAEFHSNTGNACNLASLRLTGFLGDDGTVDVDAFEHVARLFTVVLDISNSMASFPAAEFALGAYNFRTIGLGYMDLGGLLMRLALPYDSDEGRALAAAMTALMTGVAYRTSTEMAEELGPFPRWEANAEAMRRVLRNHARAACVWKDSIDYEGLNVEPPFMNDGIVEKIVPGLYHAIVEAWGAVLKGRSFRNAQVTLQAPTGTIHLVTDCDTSGIEPDYALVKTKTLAGGGEMRIVNQAVPAALRRLGYDETGIKTITDYIEEHGKVPEGDAKTWAVFACVAELRPMAHVEMVAAIQPFLSGASSKTVNLPNSATVEDVSDVYRAAHRLGLKAISLYRDGSKLTQPLASVASTTKEAAPRPGILGSTDDTAPSLLRRELLIHSAIEEQLAVALRRSAEGDLPPERGNASLRRGEHEHLPWRRERGYTQKARIGDDPAQTIFWRVSEYPDGRAGEVFIELAHEGSTMRALANCVAIAVSVGLQHGVPLEKYTEQFVNTKFEPAGYVEGHERVRLASSIADLIGRDLAITYLGREDLANTVHAVAIGGDAVVALDKRAVAVAEGRATGELCRRCGGLLVRSGTCFTCTQCGTSEGGCG